MEKIRIDSLKNTNLISEFPCTVLEFIINYQSAKFCGGRKKTDRVVTFHIAANSIKICFEKNAFWNNTAILFVKLSAQATNSHLKKYFFGLKTAFTDKLLLSKTKIW